MDRQSNRKKPGVRMARVEKPSRNRLISAEGILGIALTVLLPPLGLIYLWRRGLFVARGRMVLTALATLEMMGLFVLITPHQQLTQELPLPAAPASVTAAPAEENLNALYNIEELLYEQQLAQGKDAVISDNLTEEEQMEQANAANEALYDQVVYSVYSGAKYYHSSKVCRNQTNGRELTVREAMREGLAPCPNCNPPVPTGM